MYNLVKSLNDLFISKVRIKTIKYFLFNPDVPIHLRGAVREFKEEINAVRRELSRLEEIDYIRSEVRGNRKYYLLNPKFPLLTELLGIFHKTFGIGGAIINNQEKLGDIHFAILTGSFTNVGSSSANKVDLVVIGEIVQEELNKIVEDAESKMGRQINYTTMKSSEFILRKKRRDAFVLEVLMGNKIILIGDNEGLMP